MKTLTTGPYILYVSFEVQNKHCLGGTVYDSNKLAEIRGKDKGDCYEKAFSIFNLRWDIAYDQDELTIDEIEKNYPLGIERA